MDELSAATSSGDSVVVADTDHVTTAVDCSGLAARLVASVLRQRVVDAEKTVGALKLIDIRVSVSAHGPRGTPADHVSAAVKAARTDEVLVRPRILPAVKSSLTASSTRHHSGYNLFKSVTRRRRQGSTPTTPTSGPVETIQATGSEAKTGIVAVNEPTSVGDLLPDVLRSGVVICPGCQDASGRPVITITCRADCAPVWHRANITHLARLLLYCCCNGCCGGCSLSPQTQATIAGGTGTCRSNRSSHHSLSDETEQSVTLIADTRTLSSSDAVDTLLNVLHVVQLSRRGAISTVCMLVDKQSETLLSQSPAFQTETYVNVSFVHDSKELSKFVDVSLLPTALNGDLNFNVERWIDFQQKLEGLVNECNSAAGLLMSVTDEITQSEGLPSSVYECRAMINQHTQRAQSVLERPLFGQLIDKGEASLTELSSMIGELGSGSLFRELVDASWKLYSQVSDGYRQLTTISADRMVRLEQCLQLRQFEDRASSIINWLCTEGEDGLRRHNQLSDNLHGIAAQRTDFDKFQAAAQVQLDASVDVLDEAAMSTQFGLCDQTTGVREICRELKHRVSTFTSRLSSARYTINAAFHCYRSLNQTYEWAVDTMKLINSIQRQRSLLKSEIEQSIAELDACVARRPEFIPLTVSGSQTVSRHPGLDQLAERCQLGMSRRTETENHLQMCRAALCDALDRLVAADRCAAESEPTSTAVISRRLSVPTLPDRNPLSAQLLSRGNSCMPLTVDSTSSVNGPCDMLLSPAAFDVSEYMITSHHSSPVLMLTSSNSDIDCGQTTADSTPATPAAAAAADKATFSGVGNVDDSVEDGADSMPENISSDVFSAARSANDRRTKRRPMSEVIFESSGPTAADFSRLSFLSGDFEQLSASFAESRTRNGVNQIGSASTPLHNLSMSSSSSSVQTLTSPSFRPVSAPSVKDGTTRRSVFGSGAALDSTSRSNPKRHSHRWKLFRKAISFVVDKDRTRSDNVAESSTPNASRFELEQQQRALNLQAGSFGSLPSLFENGSSTCIANDGSDPLNSVSAGDEVLRCKYGWLVAPGESVQNQQLVYANHHASSQRSVSALDLRTAENEARRNRVLYLVMQELIQTERDYVRALGYVIENYIPEILRDSVPQPLRGKKNVIFENIEKIYDFHSRIFLSKIENCIASPYQLGSCFLMHESEFYLYALYNKNKPKSDELMMDCGTEYFKAKQRELNDRMDLSSYLLKPVQRMGKYALLLAQITDECPTSHPNHGDLKAALEMVRFQLRHGNDLLAMDCIRSCDVNLHEQGMLLRQAQFVVWHGRKKCLRQVFLFEDIVIFTKTRHSPAGNDVYIYKHSIKTTDVGLTESVGSSNDTFELWFRKRTPSATFTLRASSSATCVEWINDIARLLWKQTLRNKERRLAEMVCLGVGDKPSLDLKKSDDNINDRFVDVSLISRGVRLRTSLPSALSSRDHHLRNGNKRPHSLVSVSSSSSSGSGWSAPGAGNGFLMVPNGGGLFMRHSYQQPVDCGTSGTMATHSSGFGSLLGALSTMHESPLELLPESRVSVSAEETGDLDDLDESGSLLREIDNQLKSNAIANSSAAALSDSPYDTAASDNSESSANATGDEGQPAIVAVDEFADDNAFFEALEPDSTASSVFSESCKAQEQQQTPACIAVQDACCQTTLPRSTKLCLMADGQELNFS